MILDTNALSAFADGDPKLGALLRTAQRACLPVIVLGEFRYGIANSKYRTRYETWLTQQLPLFEILSITEATTQVYASVRVSLKKNGTPIPANDVWIAALALEHKLPVVTQDRDFDHVIGVSRIAWDISPKTSR